MCTEHLAHDITHQFQNARILNLRIEMAQMLKFDTANRQTTTAQNLVASTALQKARCEVSSDQYLVFIFLGCDSKNRFRRVPHDVPSRACALSVCTTRTDNLLLLCCLRRTCTQTLLLLLAHSLYCCTVLFSFQMLMIKDTLPPTENLHDGHVGMLRALHVMILSSAGQHNIMVTSHMQCTGTCPPLPPSPPCIILRPGPPSF